MLNISSIMNQPITKARASTISTIQRSRITDKNVLEALHPNKELSAQELMIATGTLNASIDSSIRRLIAAGKVERIKNPAREYGKPSYLFRLV